MSVVTENDPVAAYDELITGKRMPIPKELLDLNNVWTHVKFRGREVEGKQR